MTSEPGATPDWSDKPVRKPTVVLDNDKLRVVHVQAAPGERTGWHTHEHDHLVVMFDEGASLALLEGGVEKLLQSVPRFHKINPAGISHDVCNVSDHTMDFLEIEFKR